MSIPFLPLHRNKTHVTAFIPERTYRKNQRRTGQKKFPQPELVDKLLETDQKRRSLQSHQMKPFPKAINWPKKRGLFKSGHAEKVNALKSQSTELKTMQKFYKSNFKTLKWPFCPSELKFQIYLMRCSIGKLENDNEEVFSAGAIPDLWRMRFHTGNWPHNTI